MALRPDAKRFSLGAGRKNFMLPHRARYRALCVNSLHFESVEARFSGGTLMHDPLISPKYRLSHWETLKFDNEDDWLKAIEIVEDRIRGRFVVWIDRIASEQFSGFAVIALDCLLLETL